MRQIEWISDSDPSRLGQMTPLIQLYVQRGDRLEAVGRARVMAEAQARRNIEKAVKKGGSVPMGYSAERGRVLSWYFYDGHYWTEGRPDLQPQAAQGWARPPRIRTYVLRHGRWGPFGPPKEMSEAEARRNIERSGTAPLMYSAEIDMQSYGVPEPVVSWYYYNGAYWFRRVGDEWRRESAVSWVGDPSTGQLGATADNRALYEDCNLAMPSETGKEIIKRLQAMLQRQMPGYDVLQTGFIDAETCAAWRDSPTSKFLTSIGIPYPQNFNVTNILDTIDGRTGSQHHWRCNGPKVSPDCSKTTPRGTGDPCPIGQKRDPATGACKDIVCGAGQEFDPETNGCVDVSPTPRKKKKKSKLGLLLLGGAAAAAAAYAMA